MAIPTYLRLLLSSKRFILGLSVFLTLTLMGLIGPLLYPVDPLETIWFANGTMAKAVPPCPQFPLGTDIYGRDMFARLLHAIRYSLYVGTLTALIAMAIGLPIGIIAGFRGGIIDEVLMALTNIVLAIPNWIVAVLIASYIPPEQRGPELIAFIIGVFSWPWFARAVRSQFLSLREREFVHLSRMAGLSETRIAFEDLLPLLGAYIVASFTGFMAGGIGGEAGLAILGAGITRTVSLGVLLWWASYQQAYIFGYWWLFVPPGLAIVGLMASLRLIGVSLEPLFNPRLREA